MDDVKAQNRIMNVVAPIELAKHNITNPLFSQRFIFWLGYNYHKELMYKAMYGGDNEGSQTTNEGT